MTYSIRSAEELFWALKEAAAQKHVTPSLMGKLAHACGDYDAALDALRLALAARDPRAYIGAVIRQRAPAHAPEGVVMSDDPKVVPAWVLDARREGYEVRWTGKAWERNGRLWDDDEREVA